MRIIPMEWEERADLFRDSTLTWPEACIIILLVSFTEPGQTIAPRTAGVYVSAVKKFLQNNGVDTKFMDNSQYIRNTKAGLAQLYRIKTNRTDADRERISITSDMIRIYYVVDGGANPTLSQMAVYTAAMLGFTIVARVSEYLETDTSAHMLTSAEIVLELPDGRMVPSHKAHQSPSMKRGAKRTTNAAGVTSTTSRRLVWKQHTASPVYCGTTRYAHALPLVAPFSISRN